MKVTTTILFSFSTLISLGQTNPINRPSKLTEETIKSLDSLSVENEWYDCYYNGYSNSVQKIDRFFPKKGFYLFVNENEFTRIGQTRDEFKLGRKLYLVNTSDSIISFFVMLGNRFDIFPEAQDSAGNWTPIGYNRLGWCGNGYSQFNLDKNYFWAVDVPIFKGSFKTNLRYVLRYGHSQIYSNAIVAYINLAQLKPSRNKY